MAAKYKFCLLIIPAIICLYSAKAMEDDKSSVLGYSAKDLESEQSMRALYEKWMMKHQRFYNGIDEASIRYDIFKDNLKFIEAENGEEGRAYVLGLNKFADLSNEEFMQKYLGSKTGAKDRASNFKYGNLGPNDLPSSVDWREKGAVGAIKDQGKCGSCWAFSTIASVEGINQITTGKLISLSEQQLVDCSKDKNQGCNGGWLDHAFKYIMKNGGIDSEQNYPYQASDGQCKKNKIKNYIVSIDDYEDVPTKNETALQAAVANQPVSVCIEASGRSFQFYAKGIFTGKCGTKLDHAVNIVGYGTEDGLDYWTVRNSWGPKWGENGYIRMQRNLKHKSGKCGIGLEASYPIKKLTNPNLEEL